ncbi:MAG: hypothetical protein AAF628_29480 [Planctomycetota bacterium]
MPNHLRSPFWSIMGMSIGGLALSCSAQPPASWHPTNPGGGGWFERVAVGPTGVVIACSDLSGAYVSRDRGASWRAIGAPQGLSVTHVAGAAFHPTDPARIYLATDAGVFRSADGGATWQRGFATGYVEHVAVAPRSPWVVYAARHSDWNVADGHLYKSVDHGVSWRRVDATFPAGHRIVELLVGRDSASTVYALTGAGRFAGGPRDAFRSTDGGVSWTRIGGVLQGRALDVSLDPHDASTLWATADDADPGAFGHLYKSANRGLSWTEIDRRGGHVWVDAATPGTIRTFESRYTFPWDPREGFWESTQGGMPGSWTRVGSAGTWSTGWSTAFWASQGATDFGGVAADPSDPGVLYWVNSQFAYASFDRGRTVEPLFTSEQGGTGTGRWQSRGIDNVVIIDLAINEARPDEIYAGFFDLGTWRSLDGGDSWSPINDPGSTAGWVGAGGHTWSIVADPAVPGLVWAPQGEGPHGDSTLLRSGDAGATWTAVGAGLPAAPLLGMSLDRGSPVGNRTLFASAAGDVYASVDHGATWSRRLVNGGLRCTAVDRHDRDLIYAGGESGLWRSTAAGAAGSWTEVGAPRMRGAGSGLPLWFWTGVHDIESDPNVAGRVYAAVTGAGEGLFRSDDYGATWTSQPILVDDFMRCVAVDPSDSRTLYATSSFAVEAGGFDNGSNGVWRSDDAGASWSRFNGGLDWPFAIPIVVHPTDPAIVFVGSPGTGIHKLTPGLAKWTTFGQGCPGSAGTPELFSMGPTPRVGATIQMRVQPVPAGVASAMGISSAVQAPPLSLSSIGAPGCGLLLDVPLFIAPLSPSGLWSVPLPAQGSAIGARFVLQSLHVDAAGLSISNGALGVIGQ